MIALFCPKCGSETSGSGKYCAKCGFLLDGKAEDKEEEGKKPIVPLPAIVCAVVAACLAISLVAVFVIFGGSRDDENPLAGIGLSSSGTTASGADKLSMYVSQVDNSAYPDMVVYSSIFDDHGNQIYDNAADHF